MYPLKKIPAIIFFINFIVKNSGFVILYICSSPFNFFFRNTGIYSKKFSKNLFSKMQNAQVLRKLRIGHQLACCGSPMSSHSSRCWSTPVPPPASSRGPASLPATLHLEAPPVRCWRSLDQLLRLPDGCPAVCREALHLGL